MPRWKKGEETVERLLEARHLERVAAGPDVGATLLAAAQRHVASAKGCADTDPEGAYALAYDAARKASTGLLAHQGLRPTTTGGHLSVVEATRAQFPEVPGLRSLDRLRRRRNQAEYPDAAGYDPIIKDEVLEAIEVAEEACSSATKLLDVLGVF